MKGRVVFFFFFFPTTLLDMVVYTLHDGRRLISGGHCHRGERRVGIL